MIDFTDLLAIMATEDAHEECEREEECDNEYIDKDDSDAECNDR